MKFNQIKIASQVLTKPALKQLKGGNSNSDANTSIIITEDIDIM